MSTKRRMRNIFRQNGRSVIIALDHGLIDGPITGLEKPASTIAAVIEGGADAILTSYGVVTRFAEELAGVGLILRADGAATNLGTPSDGSFATPAFTIEDALRLGVDALAVTGLPGSDKEEPTLTMLANLVGAAHRWGMPVLGEMVPGGFDSPPELRTVEAIAAAARVGAELGSDFIKAPYAPGYELVTSSTYVPVVILGGSKHGERETLQHIRDAIDAGASGVAIGRNVFQSADPKAMTAAIAAIVHHGATVDDSVAMLP